MAYKNKSDPRDREAKRRYYERNKGKYYEINTRKRRQIQDWLYNYKLGKPCMDCGEKFPPYVLDFDHRDPTTKRGLVSKLSNRRSFRLMHEEIAKCDVVCSNCHRIRTHARLSAQQVPERFAEAA